MEPQFLQHLRQQHSYEHDAIHVQLEHVQHYEHG